MGKKIIIILLIASSNHYGLLCQTNLVANGSFEDFIPVGSQDLLPYNSPFYNFLDPAHYAIYEQNTDDIWHLTTLAHQIDCWETYDYTTSVFEQSDLYNEASIIVLSANQGSLFISDPNGTFGFGVPYGFEPSSYQPFGINQNVLAVNTAPTHSETYIAMITNRWHANECDTATTDGGVGLDRPKLSATLIEELVPNKTYTFSIDIQKIAHLNSYCPGGPDSPKDLKNPRIKIRVYKSVGVGSKNILPDLGWTTIDETSWQNKTHTFQVNSAGYDRIEIMLDGALLQNRGVFLDNVQLYAECLVAPENTCANPELFKPLLDIDIHSVEFETTVGGVPITIKTVEVSGLKVATYAKITITDVSGTITYRTIFEGENPPDVIMWDGKDDAGDIMPDVHYKCKVEASNLCYPLQTFIKKFKKESEIQVFNPDIYVNDWGGVTINGLHDAAFVAVSVVYVLTDVEVFYGQVGMPEDSIGWNGSIGNNLFPFTPPVIFVESGYYRVSVAIESKCGLEIYSEILFINELEIIASYFSGDYNDPLYQWGVVPDKIIPPCGYFINDNPFYRVPKDCCLGDLYLNDAHLWGDMTFNILGTIHINNNVTFDPDSEIIMNAGEGFIIQPNPDGSAFVIASNVTLIPSVICDCNCNKSFEYDQDSMRVEKIELDSTIVLPQETIKQESVKLTPNPATDFVSVLIPESKNYTKYELFNSKGEIVFDGQVISKEFRIDISKITPGEYFIRFTSETERETVKLIVQ